MRCKREACHRRRDAGEFVSSSPVRLRRRRVRAMEIDRPTACLYIYILYRYIIFVRTRISPLVHFIIYIGIHTHRVYRPL